MKSSKCLFSKTVFKSDLKRFLPFAVPLLIAEIILFPIVLGSKVPRFTGDIFPFTVGEFTDYSNISGGFAFVFAAVMALLVFSYLYTPNKCNALHAFPIGRRALFITHFAVGYLLLVIPQLLGFAAGIPAIAAMSKETGKIVALQCASVFGESLVYFALAVLAVMLAANIFAGAVIYLVLNFAWSAISSMLLLSVSALGYGVEGVDYDNIVTSYFSPAVRLFTDKLLIHSEVFAGKADAAEGAAVYYRSLLVLVIAAVVVTVLAYLLYKARALECAGDMVAFKAEIPVIGVLVSVLGGAYLAMFIGIFIGTAPAILLTAFVIFSLLLFFAAQMILHKSAKVFGAKQFILWALACALSVALVLGLAHYETNRIPKADLVESLTVNASYDMELTDRADIEAAQKLHKLLRANRSADSMSTEEFPYGSMMEIPYDENDKSFYVNLEYTLKNGRIVNRTYYCDGKNQEITAALDDLETAHRPQSCFERLKDYELVIKSVRVEDYSNQVFVEDYLNTDEFDTVYQLCEADTAALLADYRTSARNRYDTDSDYRISFECTIKSEAAAIDIWELAQQEGVCGAYLRQDDVDPSDSFYVEMDVNDDTPGVKAYLQQRSGN